jgi:hypothetical protein
MTDGKDNQNQIARKQMNLCSEGAATDGRVVEIRDVQTDGRAIRI